MARVLDDARPRDQEETTPTQPLPADERAVFVRPAHYELTGTCEAAGYKVAIKPREIRAGVRISMIEDPDGNWVELLEVTPQS